MALAKHCGNCGKAVTDSQNPLIVVHANKRITQLCDDCLQARKISVTLVKVDGAWKFEQYHPVEA
ncbi:MAG: hypothetical protein CMK74_00790 [Pseudomonadales bacterium]|nr:hypothetical protein [Pseudomonadales bacterium]